MLMNMLMCSLLTTYQDEERWPIDYGKASASLVRHGSPLTLAPNPDPNPGPSPNPNPNPNPNLNPHPPQVLPGTTIPWPPRAGGGGLPVPRFKSLQ